MSLKLKQLPVAADEPVTQLDTDGPVRRYMAVIEREVYSVLVSRDNIGRDGIPEHRWHVSVAGEQTVPPWNHFAAIVHELRPGVVFCLPMPPRSQWLNRNERVLHAWEIADAQLASQWAFEGRGDKPT